MKLENNKNYLDEKVWRCRSKIKVKKKKKKLEKIPCSNM